jgi:hypothetical protein
MSTVPFSLLDSLELPELAERAARKVSRSGSTLFEEPISTTATSATTYSEFYASDDDVPCAAALDVKPLSEPLPPVARPLDVAAVPNHDDVGGGGDNDEEDETEEAIARRVQQRKIEALLRRQRAAQDGYIQSKPAVDVQVHVPATPVAPVSAPKVAVTPPVPVVVDAPVEELTPQQQRAKALAMRNARLASPFMSGPAATAQSHQRPPVVADLQQQAPPQVATTRASVSSGEWRRDSDLFLASLHSSNSSVPVASQVTSTAGATTASYETPDLSEVTRCNAQAYGYEADSSVTYSMPDIATVASSSQADDVDSYAEPAIAVYSSPTLRTAAAAASPASLASLPRASPSAPPSKPAAPLVRAWNEEFQRLWVAHVAADQRMRSSAGAANDDRPGDELSVMLSIGQLVSEFTASATRIGRTIISETFLAPEHKTYKPIAVGGVGGGLKFAADGIFFKFAVDEYGLYGGNEYAAKSASHELRHMQLLMAHVIGGSLRTAMLHFPLMTIITHRGFRLIATTQLPIDASTIEYGSANAAVTIHNAADVAPVMQELAAELNLASHHVVSRDGRQRFLLHACADIEVHRGRDDRLYVIDCHRLLPPTMPLVVASTTAPGKVTSVLKNANLFYLFRPTFVRSYARPLSPDSFSGFADRTESAEFNRACREATTNLLEVVVPRAARRFEERIARLGGSVGSLRRLVEVLHREGVNVRFLGYVRQSTAVPALRRALLTEMVARTIKQVLNTGLRKLQTVLLQDYCDYVYRFFNENIFGGRKLRSVAWWANDGPAALLQRFARSFDAAQDGADLRALIDERVLYDRLRELTGVDFGRYDEFVTNLGDVQHGSYNVLELQPVVHRLWVLPVFEATLLLQEALPSPDAPLAEHTAFYERVRSLFIESLSTRPEDVAALDGLGLAFKAHAVVAARHRRGALALSLFAEALECFRDALAIAPASHLAVLHFDHGVTLAALARVTIDARRARLDDALREQVIEELQAESLDDPKKQAHADSLLRRLQATQASADSAPLLAPSDADLSATFARAGEQFALAAALDARDFDALFNQAHCVLMAEIVNVSEEVRPPEASLLAVPGSRPEDDALEARRQSALQASALAQALCERAVRLQIEAGAGAAAEAAPAGGELRVASLNRMRTALEADATLALALSGRRSPRSERRRERLRSLSPVLQAVTRSWPPRKEEVEVEPAARDESSDEHSDEHTLTHERGFSLAQQQQQQSPNKPH